MSKHHSTQNSSKASYGTARSKTLRVLKDVYSRHSLLMLFVWSFVGFYIDRLQGLGIAIITYLIIAPTVLFVGSWLRDNWKLMLRVGKKEHFK